MPIDLLTGKPIQYSKPIEKEQVPIGLLTGAPIPKLLKQDFKSRNVGSGILEDVKTAVGIGETALSMATHIPAKTLSGFTKLGAAPFVGVDKAEKWGAGVEEALTYETKTKRGQDIGKLLSTPFEKLSEYGEKRGDLELKESGSVVAAAAKNLRKSRRFRIL